MSNDYLALTDVKERMDRTVAGLYDDGDSTSDEWIQDDINSVEGWINQRLDVRYTLPVTNTSALAYLKGLAEDLLHERAYRRLPSGDPPKGITDAATRAREELDAIANGAPLLGSTTSATIKTSGNDTEMTRAKLAGY